MITVNNLTMLKIGIMINRVDNRRLSLLWRTVLLLTIFVVISQVIIYIWVQRSVNSHFEQMDSEIITHAAFNLRQRITQNADQILRLNSPSASGSAMPMNDDHLHSSQLDYELKMLIADKSGRLLLSNPSVFRNELPKDFDLLALRQDNDEQPFVIDIDDRRYRAIIIEDDDLLALIALPIGVHHQYLLQFNRQLILILFVITLLLVSIAALSVYWGFAPLTTIIQKMKSINPERLGERVAVSDMPLELRPLAESYNLMMVKLESNFESLSRFSDNIAHELRTPIATLSTQTQVMLNKPREDVEYIEQLHHQHETLEQLSAMINNMLLLAKTQKGLNDSQIGEVDTESIITTLIDYYEMIAEERGITFDKSGKFKAVLGDAGLLQRLFANLISNAIYYAASKSVIAISATMITTYTNNKTNKNHETTYVSQTLQSDNSNTQITDSSWLQVTIANRLEQPLSQNEADKLFERFYRHDKSSHQHSGTGLGLSIVQAIANAHKGTVGITIKDDYCFKVIVRLLIAR